MTNTRKKTGTVSLVSKNLLDMERNRTSTISL
jgi:hypothetical protein